MSESISRRSFIRNTVKGLGVAAAGAPLLARTATAAYDAEVSRSGSGESEAAGSPAPTERELASESLERLVAPVAAGTKLGGATVIGMEVDARGRGVITISGADGRHWAAELLRRESGGDANVRPLALTQHYAFFVRNGADGSSATDEQIGKAIVAVADRVRHNERSGAPIELTSKKRLWASMGYRDKA